MNKVDKLIDDLTSDITSIYRDIETELIYRIAEFIRDNKNGGSLEYLVQRLMELDLFNEETLQLIASITGKPMEQIYKDLEKITHTTIDYDMYDKAFNKGLIYSKPNKVLIERTIANHQRYLEESMNYVRNTVQKGMFNQTFVEITNAQGNVALGLMTPEQALAKAVDNIAKKGIRGDSYIRQGKVVHQSMDSVVRRAIRDSFVNMANSASEEVGNDIGVDTWYVTQHLGARTTGEGYKNHAQWQGKVYTTYELMTVCGKGSHDKLGLDGYGCRHRQMPFIKGVSVTPPPTLNMEELERVYALEQKQNRMQRKIRETKRSINALKALGTDEANELILSNQKLLRRQQKNIREFVKKNDDVLKRNYAMEKVKDYN